MKHSKLTDPIVTAEKYMEYKKKNGHLKDFNSPKIVLVCYQESTLQHLLNANPKIKESASFSNLYFVEDNQVGILGGWGMGAPALSVKMEQLIALGVEKFIAVRIAGTLMNRHQIGDFIIAETALAEDGVAHLYLKGEKHVKVDEELLANWKEFSKSYSLPNFHVAGAWSFSALFKETPADIIRVTKLGYDVVEMEAATLYAIGQEKEVQALHKLSEWALQFCKESSKINE
jgi:purine-nucleoside phosphorylase